MPRIPSLITNAACLVLAGCQATTTQTSANAPAATALAPAPSETLPPAKAAPPVPLGERPSVPCAAKHPLVSLPLSAVNVDAWAASIAAYKPQANGGRPVAWEGAESAVKAYLEAVHACVHVAFADSFLASLEGLPREHPLSDGDLATTVELVVEGETGKLEGVGVVASSGVAEFDAAALAAFGSAFPLDAPPAESLSSDGRLYVTWELHRRREQACSAGSARAWKLRF